MPRKPRLRVITWRSTGTTDVLELVEYGPDWVTLREPLTGLIFDRLWISIRSMEVA